MRPYDASTIRRGCACCNDWHSNAYRGMQRGSARQEARKEIMNETEDKGYEIKVTWFRPSGKYYTDGSFFTKREDMLGVFYEFQDMLAEGIRPGLVDSKKNEFFAVLDCSAHPHGFPMMFRPNCAWD